MNKLKLTLTLTGLSATSSLGSVTAFNEIGWGRDTWGFENWGESAITVPVTGISAASTLGTLTTTQLTVASLTGISLAASEVLQSEDQMFLLLLQEYQLLLQ